MPAARLGDTEIHYESHGTGDALLLVPGLGGVGSYWTPNLAALSTKYRVVVHDHRGCGKSTRSELRYSIDQMADDVLRLLDHLGIARAHLVGQSTGGTIGQTLAIMHPERIASLVLCSTWHRADPYFRRVFEARRALLTEAGVGAYVRATPVFTHPDWWINRNIELLEAREKTTIANFPPVGIAASRIDALLEFDRTAGLSGIRAPTLVLCAADDVLTPPYFSKELARRIPGAALRILPRGGHCVSETAPEDFNAAVLEFLSAQRQPDCGRNGTTPPARPRSSPRAPSS